MFITKNDVSLGHELNCPPICKRITKTLTKWIMYSSLWEDFFQGLTQLLIGFAALAVVTEVVFGAAMFPGMNVVDNLTGLISQLGNGGFVGLVALLILWSILTKK